LVFLINPTKSDITKLDGFQIRFIVDIKNQKLYVWSEPIIFGSAIIEMKKSGIVADDQLKFTDCLFGMATDTKGGKLNLYKIYYIFKDIKIDDITKRFQEIDLSWADEFFFTPLKEHIEYEIKKANIIFLNRGVTIN